MLHTLSMLVPRLRALWYRISSPLWIKALGPDSLVFGRLRFAHPFCNIRIGRHAMLGHGNFFQTGRGAAVKIGDNFNLNRYSLMVISQGLTIGNNVAIGEFVSIRDEDHVHDVEHGVWGQGYKGAPIVIGDNVWIGRGAFIGPGTIIGSGCIVAANATVRGKFPPNVLIAGVPGVVKKSLDS